MTNILKIITASALLSGAATLVSCDSNTPLNEDFLADATLPDIPAELSAGEVLYLKSDVLGFPYEVFYNITSPATLDYEDPRFTFILSGVVYEYITELTTRTLSFSLYNDTWDEFLEDDKEKTVLELLIEVAVAGDADLKEAAENYGRRFSTETAEDFVNALNDNATLNAAGLVADYDDTNIFVIRNVVVSFNSDGSATVSRSGPAIGWDEDEDEARRGSEFTLTLPVNYTLTTPDPVIVP